MGPRNAIVLYEGSIQVEVQRHNIALPSMGTVDTETSRPIGSLLAFLQQEDHMVLCNVPDLSIPYLENSVNANYVTNRPYKMGE